MAKTFLNDRDRPKKVRLSFKKRWAIVFFSVSNNSYLTVYKQHRKKLENFSSKYFGSFKNCTTFAMSKGK